MTIPFHHIYRTYFKQALIVLFGVAILSVGCAKKDDTPAPSSTPSSYTQVNLVADSAGFNATRIDPNLKNAWGVAIGPTGAFWIASNHAGASVVYDYNGAELLTAVNIPLNAALNGGSPTGVVYNNTTDFTIAGNGVVAYLYASEDGFISAWNGSIGASTVTVASGMAAGAIYKGIALGSIGTTNFIYATDFHNAKVDVYDKNFAMVTDKPFADPNIPTGFAPFNIQNIDGQLYVTYAKQKGVAKADDESGSGNGYVNIFSTSGVLVKRFATQGTLNSPWGIVKASSGFGQVSNAILVGNFGDGHINIFDANGSYQGQLLANGTSVNISGLWALTFDNVSPANPNYLYFTAGPKSETHGLFGYLKLN